PGTNTGPDGWKQAHNGKRGHTFAAAGFTDHSQGLILCDRVRYVAHSGMPAAADAELGHKVFYFKYGICLHRDSERSLGSIASRNASPSRLSASTVRRMARLGKTVSHHASRMCSKPSRIMLPQVAVGGGTPKPIK